MAALPPLQYQAAYAGHLCCCLWVAGRQLQLFGEVLGKEFAITREEHLPAGGRRCVYRIRRLPAR